MQIPLAYISVLALNLPLHWAMAVVAIADVIKIVICYYRYFSKKWMNVLTGMDEEGRGESLLLVYLDNSATTRPSDAVTAAMTEAMKDNFGNPSSLHSLGLQAEKEVKMPERQWQNALVRGKMRFISLPVERNRTIRFSWERRRQRKEEETK